MRTQLIAILVGSLALGFALGVQAKTAVHYAADQVVCPTASQSEEEAAAQIESAPAPGPATRTPSTEPVKSGKSTRGKWKALLPGTIK
jgi:hypothetical protein